MKKQSFNAYELGYIIKALLEKKNNMVQKQEDCTDINQLILKVCKEKERTDETAR